MVEILQVGQKCRGLKCGQPLIIIGRCIQEGDRRWKMSNKLVEVPVKLMKVQ